MNFKFPNKGVEEVEGGYKFNKINLGKVLKVKLNQKGRNPKDVNLLITQLEKVFNTYQVIITDENKEIVHFQYLTSLPDPFILKVDNIESQLYFPHLKET